MVADIDSFAIQLLEESKRFAEKCRLTTLDLEASCAFRHAALLLVFCALEAHVNAIAEEVVAHIKVIDNVDAV